MKSILIEKGLFFLVGVALVAVITFLLPSCNSTDSLRTGIGSPVQNSINDLPPIVPAAPKYTSVKGTQLNLKGLSKQDQSGTTSRTIKEITIPLSRVVDIAGEVSENATSGALQIAALNKKSKDPIWVILESPGGSVLMGGQLISAMQASRAPVFTVCRTLCASMAFMIFEYGTKRYATDRTILMAHPASGMAEGRVDNMVSMLRSLQKSIGKMESDVANRMNLTFEQYKAKVVNEYWVDAEDGITDNAVDELVSLKLNDDIGLFNTAPSPENRLVIKKPSPLKFDIRWITE